MKPIYPGMRAFGPALTMSCHPADNMMLITAISLAKPGDVLVVSAGDDVCLLFARIARSIRSAKSREVRGDRKCKLLTPAIPQRS